MNKLHLGIALTAVLLLPSVSHAYVDPGSGSVIVTTILGFAAAVGYSCRKYFYKIRNILLNRKNNKTKSDDGKTGNIEQ